MRLIQSQKESCAYEEVSCDSGALARSQTHRLRLRNTDVGLGLAGVNEVNELDAILNEEDWDVVCGRKSSATARKATPNAVAHFRRYPSCPPECRTW